MRVKWNSIGGTLLKETDLMKRLEMSQIKRQIELLTTFLPDIIIELSPQDLPDINQFVGVLLFADVSGFTPLCEKFNRTGKRGIYRLTATLNAYIGAIVEVIYFYGGDVLKFSGDAFLALWQVGPEDCLYKVIHEVIVCALFIQKTLGCFETEVNVLLKVKLAISCGNMAFSIIGDEENKHYVILGPAINDVKAAEHASVSGDVVIAPAAWGHIAEESYEVTYATGGNVKVWRCLYKPNERAKMDEYEQKDVTVNKLCEKHIHHRSTLYAKTQFGNSLSDSRINESFIRSLPERKALKSAWSYWRVSQMEPFVIRPVQEQIIERQPLEYLTEMREVTIQFINIVPTTYEPLKLAKLVNSAYQAICTVVCKLLGVVNKVSLFDKDCMVLVLFGLKGIKHETESQNALRAGYEIRRTILTLDCVKSASVGITNGFVYCGVVGHPLRREYTVIGDSVNKAARMMCAFENKVTCDFKTYKNAKLSSYYFQLQMSIKLKGIEDAGHIFEFHEEFEEQLTHDSQYLPLVGRQEELLLVRTMLTNFQTLSTYKGVCFYGTPKLGKSRILQATAAYCKAQRHSTAVVDLCSGYQRPYFVLSLLYRQLYDAKARLDSPDNSLLNSVPSDIWNFNELLQRNNVSANERKLKAIENFQYMVNSGRQGITVLIIDNIQYIDTQSLDVLEDIIKDSNLRVICAGHFEEDTWDIQWKLSLSETMKMEELNPMDAEDVGVLACQFLKTRAVPVKLVTLLLETCEGRPGWVQSCLLRLVNTGCIELKFVCEDDIDLWRYVFPEAKLLLDKYVKDGRKHKIEKKLLSVAHLSKKLNEGGDDLTLAAISLDLFDSFSPTQQLVIKTGSVIGELFTRTLLFVILKYPNELPFASAIMKLFERDVLDCGSRYITSGGLSTKDTHCGCFMEDEEYNSLKVIDSSLPKYAFCKLLHFKNKSLKAIAYQLLPSNQKKELHSRITDVLEGQQNACPNCLRDDSVSIINLKPFKSFMQYCNESSRYLHDAKSRKKTDSHLYADAVKGIVRKLVNKDLPQEDNISQNMSPVTVNTSNKVKFSRKIWDPTTCFCLEILTRVYTDLIYHSENAGLLGKRIFYLMQYGIILVILQEFREAIAALTQASELCLTESQQKGNSMNEVFRKLCIGKIHMLLAECSFRLGEISKAKSHISISLRQYNIPLISLKYKIPNLLLTRLLNYNNRKIRISKLFWERGTLDYTDCGICLNLLSSILASQGRRQLAKSVLERSLCLLRSSNENIFILCDAYTTAIELYNYCGDSHACERLERCISREILRLYSRKAVIELYAVCKLLSVIFQTRMLNGLINKSIRVGYRVMDLNITIQASYIQIEVIPILASALLLVKRIECAVSIINILLNIGKTGDQAAMVSYYAFSVELYIETGFILETMNHCEAFAERHFGLEKKSTFTNSEKKLIVFLHMYHLRNKRWCEALKWKTMLSIDEEEVHSTVTVPNLYKYTECLLISLKWNIEMKKGGAEVERKRIETYLKQCNTIAKKWKLFMPRYLHYQAYYNKIMERPADVKKYIKQALKWSIKQNNILEKCWIMQSKNTWQGSFSFGSELQGIDWRKSNDYTKEEWSQILYPLDFNM